MQPLPKRLIGPGRPDACRPRHQYLFFRNLTRTFHKSAILLVGAGLPASFFVQQAKSQNLAAKAAPTGLGGIHEKSGVNNPLTKNPSIPPLQKGG